VRGDSRALLSCSRALAARSGVRPFSRSPRSTGNNAVSLADERGVFTRRSLEEILLNEEAIARSQFWHFSAAEFRHQTRSFSFVLSH